MEPTDQPRPRRASTPEQAWREPGWGESNWEAPTAEADEHAWGEQPNGADWAAPDASDAASPATSRRAEARIWRDPTPLSRDWAAPYRERVSPFTKRLLAGAAALALVATAGGVWAGGGFKTRRDAWTLIEAPATLQAGPLEVRLQRVRVEHDLPQKKWNADIIGTCRNTTDEPASVYDADDMIYVADPVTKDDAVRPTGGANGSLSVLRSRESLNPGMPAVTCTFSVELPDSYRPVGYLLVGVVESTYGDITPTSEGYETWNRGSRGYKFFLPVQQMPDRE